VTGPQKELTFSSVSFRYRKSAPLALDDVSLTLPLGVTAVVGSNGSGKYTLLELAARRRRPTAGTVDSAGFSPVRPRTGYLPQQFQYPAHARCIDFLRLVSWLRGASIEDASARAEDALQAVGLNSSAHSPMRELSGGMLRRIGFAAALVSDPEVLVLDEPTTGVDAIQRRALREFVEINSPGRIVLMSSHIVEDLEILAENVIVLRSGEVQFHGPVKELLEVAGDDTLESAIIRLSGGGQ